MKRDHMQNVSLPTPSTGLTVAVVAPGSSQTYDYSPTALWLVAG